MRHILLLILLIPGAFAGFADQDATDILLGTATQEELHQYLAQELAELSCGDIECSILDFSAVIPLMSEETRVELDSLQISIDDARALEIYDQYAAAKQCLDLVPNEQVCQERKDELEVDIAAYEEEIILPLEEQRIALLAELPTEEIIATMKLSEEPESSLEAVLNRYLSMRPGFVCQDDCLELLYDPKQICLDDDRDALETEKHQLRQEMDQALRVYLEEYDHWREYQELHDAYNTASAELTHQYALSLVDGRDFSDAQEAYEQAQVDMLAFEEAAGLATFRDELNKLEQINPCKAAPESWVTWEVEK